MTKPNLLDATKALEAEAAALVTQTLMVNPEAVAWAEQDFIERWDEATVAAERWAGKSVRECDIAYEARMAQDEGYSGPMVSLKVDHGDFCSRCSGF